MSTTELTLPAPSRIGQGTAVEQVRAAAEVRAAIMIAQECPRNVAMAIAAMRESCARKELADRAFFRYKRGGSAVTGPTIHLARELARVWGNIQYGLTELRRDDDFGQSEMLAFAWDVQTNARCSSVVINPHRLYTGGRELTELRDVYENNANVGARRVREAIFAVLPTWFVEEAKELCGKTITDGGGVPLPTRIANAIEVFGNLGVTVPQLEAKVGTKSAKWTDQDVATLRVIRQSLLRGEVSKDEEFPAERAVSAADITGSKPTQTSAAVPDELPGSGPAAAEPHTPGPAASAAPAGPGAKDVPGPPQETQRHPAGGDGGPGTRKRLTKPLLGRVQGALHALPLGSGSDVADVLTALAGRPVQRADGLYADEAELVLKVIDEELEASQGETTAAAVGVRNRAKVLLAAQEQDAAAEGRAGGE